jgi:serine/threonine protein kinase, bacterial
MNRSRQVVPLVTGATFARYMIVRFLGSGGTSAVYLAEHQDGGHRVALKILRADLSGDTEFREHWGDYVDRVAKLRHPNIAQIADAGEAGQRLWVATEYVDGPDSGSLVRHQFVDGLSLRSTNVIIGAIADALDHAHDHGLLHRHVKPANILLADPFSRTYRILLTDLGTALRHDAVEGMAEGGANVGLIDYAAPEQLAGEPGDGRTDQYALAACAFHLLTGSPPFAHASPAVVGSRHRNAAVPSLANIHPRFADLDASFARGLAKKPEDRFPSCREFAESLQRADLDRQPRPARERAAVDTKTVPPSPSALHLSAPPAEPGPSGDQETTSDLRSTVVPAVIALLVVGVLTLVLFWAGGTHPV